jgi:hypothetical protein
MEAFFEDIRLRRTPVPGLGEAKVTLRVVEALHRKSNVPWLRDAPSPAC